MRNATSILPLVAICALTTVVQCRPSVSEKKEDLLKVLKHPLLSGDYVGFPLIVNIAERGDPYGYVKCKCKCKGKDKECASHRKLTFTAHDGFAFVVVKDGDHVLWSSAYMHAKSVILDSFSGKKYLSISVYLSQKPVEIKYFEETGSTWQEITRREYVIQATEHLVKDSLEVDRRKCILDRKFKVTKPPPGSVYTLTISPKFNHALTSVTFGGQLLWEYDDRNPVECIRVDRIKNQGTTLVRLHLIEPNGCYRTAIMHGAGPRSMSFGSYKGLLSLMNQLPDINVPNKDMAFAIENETAEKVVDDEHHRKTEIIRVIDGGTVPELLASERSVAENWLMNDDKINWEVLHDNLDGLITWDLVDSMDNPSFIMSKMKDDDAGVGRTVFRIKSTYLIGTIVYKDSRIFKEPGLFPYSAVIEQLDGIRILQLFVTTRNGKVLTRYFAKPFGGVWRKSSRNGYLLHRTTVMRNRPIYLDDLRVSEKYTIVNKKLAIKTTALQIVPRFNVFINKILYKENEIWVFDPKLSRMLVLIKRWENNKGNILSIETVDQSDRRHEQVYRLVENDWKLVEGAAFVIECKQPLSVDLSKTTSEGITYTKMTTPLWRSEWEGEPEEGYYIDEVSYKTTKLWAAEGRKYSCPKMYGVTIQGFQMVTLKVYDTMGDAHFINYINDGLTDNYVEVDVVLANFIARHLLGDAAFSKLLKNNKFPYVEFLRTLMVNTQSNPSTQGERKGSLRPKITDWILGATPKD